MVQVTVLAFNIPQMEIQMEHAQLILDIPLRLLLLNRQFVLVDISTQELEAFLVLNALDLERLSLEPQLVEDLSHAIVIMQMDTLMTDLELVC